MKQLATYVQNLIWIFPLQYVQVVVHAISVEWLSINI